MERRVVIDPATPKNPITLAGRMIGVCYDSDTTDDERNYNRGIKAMRDGHGRVMEYCTVWMTIHDFSAKVMREFYTHIGGAPTRTQASTRYIPYKDFDYVVPPSVYKDEKAMQAYHMCMEVIADTTKLLREKCGVPKEDANMLLPLGMTTTVSCHFNLRTLSAMAEQRLSERAYWEFRDLMAYIMGALSAYSDEWKILVDEFMRKRREQ